MQIRLKGHAAVVKTVALAADGPSERKRQLAEAQASATETRRRMMAGAHVSSREAKRTTLADALRRYEAEAEQELEQRRRIEAEIVEVELREGISSPARTTIVNVVQLISRCLNHVRQTMDSVPEIRSVRMPKASPGRERRPTPDEMERRLREASSINPALPLLMRFAVATTLRRGRALSCRLADIRSIGSSKETIAFPRERRSATSLELAGVGNSMTHARSDRSRMHPRRLPRLG